MPPSPKDLRALAKRRQPSSAAVLLKSLRAFPRAAAYLALAAAASVASQLSLAPVYGQIPSRLYHARVSTALFFASWAFQMVALRGRPARYAKLLPALALYTPFILRTSFGLSTRLGAEWGPVITEGVTYYPILVLSVLAAASVTTHGIANAFSLALGYGVFALTQRTLPGLLAPHMGASWVLTRCGLWHLLGAGYLVVSYPTLLLLGALVPALLHSATTNTMCVTTASLNSTLAAYNHSLIARTESVTGYISVLEDLQQGYRVLRCDHSLLGGEWQRAPPGFNGYVRDNFREPIYAVFVMMEAVRLVEPGPQLPAGGKPRALAIGLGIGTSADALIRHGVETDIVELDPAVYRYAKEYFYLADNHTAYIEDAVGFVERERGRRKYEYILHDVFTGGAVPAALFTREMFEGLKEMLVEDGVIAINWAGDLKLDAAQSIVKTIRSVFKNCRVYREEVQTEAEKKLDRDFTNMVTFCGPHTSSWTFRAASASDYQGSYARETYLMPRHTVALRESAGSATVLTAANIHRLEEWQRSSALGHWGVIRGVVEAGVWEAY